jgi:hypothetical protein
VTIPRGATLLTAKLRAARIVLACTLAGLLVSCASSSSTQATASGTADQLTGEQLRAAASAPDEPVYAILVRMRPQWLIARTGQPDVVVFVDGVPTGAPSTLQVIGSSRVASVRFLEAEVATRAHPGVTGATIDVRLNP